jgi:hypothetical protein
MDMGHFDEADVTVVHEWRADRSGYLRITHRPIGLFVDAELRAQPVLKTKEELMAALRPKVLSWLAQKDSAEMEKPALPAG